MGSIDQDGPTADPPRPWYRLHPLTWIVVGLTSALMLDANLRPITVVNGSALWSSWPFVYVRHERSKAFSGDRIDATRGWPLVYSRSWTKLPHLAADIPGG
jgi:hypothetical protein